MCALGQPAHMPVRRTSAEFPSTSSSSMSPPSACMKGRTRARTDSTRSLVIMDRRGATDVPPAAVPVFRRFSTLLRQRARAAGRRGGDYSPTGGKTRAVRGLLVQDDRVLDNHGE